MANRREIVYVERKRSGCLHFLLFTWLFGGFYWAWLGLKLCWRVVTWPIRLGTRVGWDVLIKWPWQVSVAACRWGWTWGANGSRALTARYGAKGWAIVGGAVAVLIIVGAVLR